MATYCMSLTFATFHLPRPELNFLARKKVALRVQLRERDNDGNMNTIS